MTSPQEEHDRLLAEKPEQAIHENCKICNANEEDHPGGDVTTKTYSEDELTSALAVAVEQATSPLRTELDALKASIAEADVETQVAAAKAAAEAEVEAVRAELDEANVAKAAAETAKAAAEQAILDIQAYLEAEKAQAEADAAAELHKEARVAVAQEFKFDEAYVTAQADRWARMDDDTWSGVVDGWKTVAGIDPTVDLTKVPLSTAMAGTPAKPSSTTVSAVDSVFAMKRSGIELGTH